MSCQRCEKLESLLKDTWMMLWHATNIDFHNGVEYMGMDEGDIKGWGFYYDLENKFYELFPEEDRRPK